MSELQYTPKIISRFYAKVSTIPTETGCLEWTAYHDRKGYGVFGLGNGKTKRAYRVAWEIINGPIPLGLVVRHFVCANPLCCNVEHFLLGTYADNAQDMVRDGHYHNAPPRPTPYVRSVGPTAAERFYAKVSKTPTETGCLEWTASSKGSPGYGKFRIDGRNVLAHRYAWELINGPIPDGMYACHRCDNRKCCNPDHIFIGTPTENVHDMIAKGRAVHTPLTGESNGNSKLTAAQVLDLRSGKYDGMADGEIAPLFGVSRTLIASVLGHRGWRHLDGENFTPVQDRQPKGAEHPFAKLTDDAVREIRSERFASLPYSEIATHFGVSRSVITNIINRKTWTHLDGSGDFPVAETRKLGLHTKGEKNGWAKLTEAQVLEIRSGDFSDLTQEEIGQLFGVSKAAIGAILNRKTWKHLGDSDKSLVQIGASRGERVSSAKLIEAQVIEIRSEKYAQMPQRKVAECFGITQSAVQLILQRKTWRHI